MITVHVCTECGGGFFEHPRRGKCHMCYERARKAGNVPGLVDAARARDHIEALVGAGWNYNQIARAARIDRSLIAFIVNGRERINADTAFHICCVDTARQAEYKAAPIDPQVAKARGRKAAATLGPEGAKARARKAADSMTPEARTARAVKMNASRTPQERSAAARKAWDVRRAKAAAAKAAEDEAAAQRERFEARRRAQAEQPLLVCTVCGNIGVWRRRGMCGSCYEAKRNVGGLEWLATQLSPPGPWIEKALCAQIDPDLWFPEKGGSTREAKKMCLSCEVRAECLEIALENEERFGIWGGLSERERRRLIKEREQPVAAHTKESA